jgi:hypothetical protein
MIHGGYARYFIPPLADQNARWAAALMGTTGAPLGALGASVRAETDNYYDLGAQKRIGDLALGIDAYWRDASKAPRSSSRTTAENALASS